MSGDDRLTPELQSLLAAEREADGPDAGARDRVAGRLAKTLGVTLAAAGASAAATSGAQTALPKALVGKSLAAKLLVAAVVGGVGAGVTVKLVHRHGARAHHAIATTPASAPRPMTNATPSPPATDAPAKLTAPSPSAVAPSPPMAAPTVTAPAHPEHHVARHDLAAERALLADARAALQSADASRALAILDEHARRFPRGQLAEERDALRVAALWRAGDHDGARRHADEFARRHPDSLFLPSVQRAVTDSPGTAQ